MGRARRRRTRRRSPSTCSPSPGCSFFGRRLRPGRAGRDLGDVSRSPGSPTRTRLRAAVELERRAARGAADLGAARCSPARSPAGRCSASPCATKFAPLALAPLFAAGERGLLDARAAGDVAPGVAAARALFAAAFAVGTGAAARPPGGRPRPGRLLRPHRREPARPRLSVQHLGPGRRDRVAAERRPRARRSRSRSWSPSSRAGARSPRSPRSPPR